MYNICDMYVYIYIGIYMCMFIMRPYLDMWSIYLCVLYIHIYVYLQPCGQIDRAKQNRIESFKADFLRDFAESVVSCLLGGRLGTCRQIQTFQGFSCDFLNSQVFSRLVRQLAYSLSSDKILFRYTCGEKKLC